MTEAAVEYYYNQLLLMSGPGGEVPLRQLLFAHTQWITATLSVANTTEQHLHDIVAAEIATALGSTYHVNEEVINEVERMATEAVEGTMDIRARLDKLENAKELGDAAANMLWAQKHAADDALLVEVTGVLSRLEKLEEQQTLANRIYDDLCGALYAEDTGALPRLFSMNMRLDSMNTRLDEINLEMNARLDSKVEQPLYLLQVDQLVERLNEVTIDVKELESKVLNHVALSAQRNGVVMADLRSILSQVMTVRFPRIPPAHVVVPEGENRPDNEQRVLRRRV